MKFFTTHIAVFFSFQLASIFATHISIQPHGIQKKELGSDVLVTCTINSQYSISTWILEWLDSDSNSITETKESRQANTRIYTNFVSYEHDQLQLIIDRLAKEDVGNYTCHASTTASSESYEEDLYERTEIQILELITFVDLSTHQSALIGTSYKIECHVEAIPEPTIKWFKNGVQLTANSRYKIKPDGLVINSVNESDDGEYRCQAVVAETNDTRYRDIRFEVFVPPKIVNTADHQKVTEGEKAQLKCEATGKPKPSITWIKTITREVVSNGIDGILNIEKVLRNETTDYTCKAENKAGEDYRDIRLSIRSKPDILEVNNSTAVVGGFGQIQCHVLANPKPRVIFRKFTSPRSKRSIDEQWNPITVETIEDPTRPDTFIAFMNFSKVQLVDDGLYECEATNDDGGGTFIITTPNQQIGQTIRKARLNVLYAPVMDPTSSAKKKSTWDNIPVNLTCITKANPKATITWYFHDEIIKRNYSVYTIFDSESSNTLQITPLHKNVYGTYKCVANNPVGETEWHINLVEAHPPICQMKTTNATSISFKIEDFVNTRELPIKGYIVQYKMEEEDWYEAKNTTWERGALYSLHNLASGEKYTFRLADMNEVGVGPWGCMNRIQMPGLVQIPSEPIIVNMKDEKANFTKSNTATSFELKWKTPSSDGGDIDYYKLKYCMAAKNMENSKLFPITTTCENKVLIFNKELTSYQIEPLISGTDYFVSLRAHNEIGDSPASEIFFKTSAATKPDLESSKKSHDQFISTYLIGVIFIVIIVFSAVSYYFFRTTTCKIVCSTREARCDKKNDKEQNKLKADFRFGRLLSNDRRIITDEIAILQ